MNTQTLSSDPENPFTRTADLSHVWDCRSELQNLYQCISGLHLLFGDYAKEDARPLCVLLYVLAEKIDQLSGMLSKTLDPAMEEKL